jgi:hypothetical protein
MRLLFPLLLLLPIPLPLTIMVRLAISQNIIHLDEEVVHERHTLDHPPYQVMRPSFRLVPRTYLYAATTRRATWVGEPEPRTALCIERVCLVSVVSGLLIVMRYRLGRTFDRTFLARFAELLKPKIDWRVRL